MDQALVEKITRLVLLKLEEHAMIPRPLSDEEIRRWNEITASFQAKAAHFSAEETAGTRPLTDEEIKRWNEITAAMQPFYH